MQKKLMIPGCIAAILSLVIAVGSVTFLGPCVHEDGTAGACFWAGRSILGLGLLVLVLSVLAVLLRWFRGGLYLSILIACILGAMTPGTLISLCKMSSMRCRAVMQPAVIILFAAAGLAALWGFIVCVQEEKGRA